MDKFTLMKEDVVFMVIDIQERLVPAMKYGEKVIEKTNTLVSIAKSLEIPILVTEQYPRGLGEIVSEIKGNLDKAAIYEKIAFSAYTEEVVIALKELGKKKVVITGMETHVCVLQTVRGLLADGYQVFVVRDAVCSRNKENYKNGLALMSAMGAVITNTETVFFDLMKEAGTPLFKTLSQLIK
jgi:nicotinamidase-related amidase